MILSSCVSPYEGWHRRFLQNSERRRTFPWNDPYRLNSAELRLVGRSIQQFELGEWARGRGLVRRAAKHPVFAADSWFRPSLQLFIAEEQGHSYILGRFLDHEHMPRLTSHWVDGIFRRLRELAGLEACATVLVTAEALAIPFYQALRDATCSPLLRSICASILHDEAAHLSYQALTLGLIRRRLRQGSQKLRARCHATLFRGTALLLWQQHRRVFRAAGWNFGRYWQEASREFERLQQRIARCADGFDALRLD